MSKPTVEQKYAWLLSKLEITDPDLWEGDALLRIQRCHESCDDCRSLYVALPMSNTGDLYIPTVDEAVELAMAGELFEQQSCEQLDQLTEQFEQRIEALKKT